MAEASETDEDDEIVENMYIAYNYGTGINDNKHAENMLKRFTESEQSESRDLLTEEEKNTEKEDNAAIAKMLDEQNAKSDITPMYKLFNLVN